MSRVTGRSTRMATPSVKSTWRRTNDSPVPVVAGDLEKEQLLEDALDEYCRLRDEGGAIRTTQFCERYPSYRHSLRRLIDVHEAMENYPVIETNQWPDLLTEFLGFEILHELGVGAIARVYLAAECAVGGRLVAIKVAKGGGYEAETLGKLSHRNVVPVYSVKLDEETGMTAVCMPYYGSSTLADVLDLGFENGKPPARAATILKVAREREQFVGFVEAKEEKAEPADPVLMRGSYVDGVAHLGGQMAEALEYTHEHGILHRDLKPSNVLLTPDGIPMLLDFNLATDIAVEGPTLGGTLPYMPPEQIKDVHLKPFEATRIGDPRSDIFSLGVILYELLTGTLPFGAPEPTVSPIDAANTHLEEQARPPVSLRELNPAVDPGLEKTINRCLSVDIAQRPATAGELVDELQRYFSPRKRLVRWCRQRFKLVMTLMVSLLVICSLTSWHLLTRPPYETRQYLAGVAAMEGGRFADALADFRSIMDEDEERIELLFAHGAAQHHLGKHDLAVADFERIAFQTEEPAILELCGFSAAQNSASIGMACFCYNKLSQSEEATEETHLSNAYAYSRRSNSPDKAIHAATQAIALNPNLERAYQLRALANKSLADAAAHETALTSKQVASEDREAKLDELRSILDLKTKLSLQDMDAAIRLGPVDGQMLLDAAWVNQLRDGHELEAQRKKLLQLALDEGAPRGFLEQLAFKSRKKKVENEPRDEEPRDEAWLQELLEQAPVDTPFASPEQAARYVSAPDYVRAQRLLRRYARDEDFLVKGS